MSVLFTNDSLKLTFQVSIRCVTQFGYISRTTVFTLPNLYIQIDNKNGKMHIWWEILGYTIGLMSEITEISILFWNKISSMTIRLICYTCCKSFPIGTKTGNDIQINYKWSGYNKSQLYLVLEKFNCTIEIDCIVNCPTGYFSSEKCVQPRSYCVKKRTVIYNKG